MAYIIKKSKKPDIKPEMLGDIGYNKKYKHITPKSFPQRGQSKIQLQKKEKPTEWIKKKKRFKGLKTKMKGPLQKNQPISPKLGEQNEKLKKYQEYLKNQKELPRIKRFKKEFQEIRKNLNIGGRANLLEEMGRIDARRHPDAADRAEKRRVIGELNRGYNKGGLVIKGKPKLAKKGWK